MNFVVSVPWSKVKANEVLLALEMNDSPLPKIHGYPLRVVVFGYIGARSVKWLYRIKAIPHPSHAPVQSKEYLYFNSQVGKHNQLHTSGIQIQETPVSSAIMSPGQNRSSSTPAGSKSKAGPIWAVDAGLNVWRSSLTAATSGMKSPPLNLSPKHQFARRTWHATLPLDVEGWFEVCVRCWDNAPNTQATFVRSAWIWGLHVTSSCHRVNIYRVNKSRATTRRRPEEFEKRGIPFMPITWPTKFPVQSMKDYEKFWEENPPRDVDD